MKTNSKNGKPILTASVIFIILMAVVSLFSDMTHEGSNSINGAFLDYLGAPSMVISVVGGVATLLGCSLRMLTGYLADRTKHYWTFTIIGYVIDLAAVPLLALVPNDKSMGFILAVAFILLEKIGKAVKKPAKDTIVSFAAKENGVGKSFAFGEALDQIGAFIGPTILTATYLIVGNIDEYHKFIYGFLALGIPALICLGILLVAFFKYRHPETFEKEDKPATTSFLKKPVFIVFLVASSLLAFGFMDSFSLVGKDLFTRQVLGPGGEDYIPLLYSFAMLIDAVSALFFGFLYDKKGLLSIVLAVLFTAPYPFFLFYMKPLWSVFVGLALWGIGMGALESIMKSAVTTLSGKSERARAFGAYELFYGLASFAGSFVIGWLYSYQDKLALCLYCSIAICLAFGVYIFAYHLSKKAAPLTETAL